MIIFLWDSADQNYVVSSDLMSLPLQDQGHDRQPFDQSPCLRYSLLEIHYPPTSTQVNKHTYPPNLIKLINPWVKRPDILSVSLLSLWINVPLELESITSLNKGMNNFKGVILFTSHDHELLQTVANRIIYIDDSVKLDKQITYDEFLDLDLLD